MIHDPLGECEKTIMEMPRLGNSTFDCTICCIMRRTVAVETSLKIADLKEKIDRPIILVGLMGAGKTKMGRLLAEALGVPFTDADDVIVARAGLSIPEIFEKHGEERFRSLEADVMRDLVTSSSGVVSTGGGAVMTPQTADFIFSDRVISIWVRAPLDVHVARTSRHGDRPLLQNTDPAEKLKDLMVARDPVYARATLTVENGVQDPKVTLEQMVSALYSHVSS